MSAARVVPQEGATQRCAYIVAHRYYARCLSGYLIAFLQRCNRAIEIGKCHAYKTTGDAEQHHKHVLRGPAAMGITSKLKWAMFSL